MQSEEAHAVRDEEAAEVIQYALTHPHSDDEAEIPGGGSLRGGASSNVTSPQLHGVKRDGVPLPPGLPVQRPRVESERGAASKRGIEPDDEPAKFVKFDTDTTVSDRLVGRARKVEATFCDPRLETGGGCFYSIVLGYSNCERLEISR